MKNNRKTIIIAAITLVTGFLAGWLIFGGSAHNTVNQQTLMEQAGNTIWTCSMHPQIRKSEPGDCPICGMDLIPLEREETGGADPMDISMSPAAMELANISTTRVTDMSPVKSVRLNGKVQADQRLVFSQSSHIPGRIEKLIVNFTGEFVTRGQTIATIYSPELVTAQDELFVAQKMKDTQPQLFKAAREKLKNWKLSDSQIGGILKSGRIQTEFPVRADVTGYVAKKMVNPGDYIERGKAIFEITDLSKVWVLFDVYESDMTWIKKGDPVEFTIESLPGEHFKGLIAYMDPVIDPTTRVSKARVEVRNSSLKLKPEMFASGTVESRFKNKGKTITIPKTAVLWTGKRSVVYVKNASAKGVSFRMRVVTLGPSLGESYVIESGLAPDEEIAVNGTFSIDAAAQLAGKPSMMNPEGGIEMTGHNHGSTETPAPSKKTATVTEPAEKNQVVIDQKAKEALQPLYTDYLNLKDALVADKLTEAQKAAVHMQTSLASVDMAVFKDRAHDTWMTFSDDLERALEHAPHAKTIEELRKAFQPISNTMIALSKSFKPMNKTMYVQHCPMADNNKGADWLSLDKDIKNPYFGESMLTCGEVTATVK